MNQSKRKTERKWIPFVMSTGILASALISAGAPASAEELELGNMHAEQNVEDRNHGKVVSEVAKSLNTPGKGSIVSEVAKNKGEVLATEDQEKTTDEEPATAIEETIDEEPATANRGSD